MRAKHWRYVRTGLFIFAFFALIMSTVVYEFVGEERQAHISNTIGWGFWLSIGGGIGLTIYLRSKFAKKTPEAVQWLLSQGWEPYRPSNIFNRPEPQVEMTDLASGEKYHIYDGARGTYNSRRAHAYRNNAQSFDPTLYYAGIVDITAHAKIPDVVFYKDVGQTAQMARRNVDVNTEYPVFNERWMVNTSEYERIREIHALLNPRLIEIIAHAPETAKCVAFHNERVYVLCEVEDFSPEVADKHLTFAYEVCQALPNKRVFD